MNTEFLRVLLAPTEGGAGGEGGEGGTPVEGGNPTEGGAPTQGEPKPNPNPQPTTEVEEKTISKAEYDKLASELAKFKREAKAKEREKMSEKERERAEFEDAKKELEALRKENSKSKAISKLSKTKASDELVEGLAEALVSNDMETVVDSIVKLVESVTSESNKELETVKLGATPRPQQGDNTTTKVPSVEDYKKMTIDERIQLKISNPQLYAVLSNSQ